MTNPPQIQVPAPQERRLPRKIRQRVRFFDLTANFARPDSRVHLGHGPAYAQKVRGMLLLPTIGVLATGP
jgi:hypothetical protein